MINWKRSLTIIFTIVMIPLTLLIMVVSIRRPQNNLIPVSMLIGTIGFIILFFVLLYLWVYVLYDRISHPRVLYWIVLVLGMVVLYIAGCVEKNTFDTGIDYVYLYRNAWSVAESGTLVDEWYFWRYENNYTAMLLLSILMKLAKLLQLEDPYYLLLFFSVLIVFFAILGASSLAGAGRWGAKVRFPVMIMILCLLPVWGMTPYFYTDTMSFGMGVMILSCLQKARTGHIGKRIAWMGLSGLLLPLACYEKITAIIPVIAGLIALSLTDRKKTQNPVKPGSVGSEVKQFLFLKLLPFALASVIGFTAFQEWENTYDFTERVKASSDPVLSWIAIGLRGDGTFGNGGRIDAEIHGLATKEEKQAYVMKYIRENKDGFTDVEHLLLKLRRNFANGNYGVNFYYMQDDTGTLLWNMFNLYGKYQWRTSQICFCYLEMMYGVLLLGLCWTLAQLMRGRDVPFLLRVFQISFFGIVFFLMLWEANDRQLYNQLPMWIIGTVYAGMCILESIQKRVKRVKSRL